MAKRLQHRGGTTSQHSTFTGAVREVTVDTDKNTLVVHDGVTAGGHPLPTTADFTSTGINDNATSTTITIGSDNKVRIGNTSDVVNPSYTEFMVIGDYTASQDNGITFLADATNSTTIGFTDDTHSTVRGGITYHHSGDSMRFTTFTAEKMRLNSTGLGIGTSSIIRDLVVKNSSGDVGFRMETASQTNDVLTLRDSSGRLDFGNIAMTILTNGRVGINNTAPSGQLHLYNASDNDARLIATGTTTSASNDMLGLLIDCSTHGASSKIRLGAETTGGVQRDFDIINIPDSNLLRLDGNTEINGGSSIGTLRIRDFGGASARTVGRILFIGEFSGNPADGNRTFAQIESQKENSTGGATDGRLVFMTNSGVSSSGLPVEGARLDSNGTFIVGGTSSSINNVGAKMTSTGGFQATKSSSAPLSLNRISTDGDIAEFRHIGTVVGSISVTSSATSYNTTSDKRLKDNIQTITDGTEKVMAMNAVTHTWKNKPDTKPVHGFIAQEMQQIIPEAVTGNPDSEEMMSMDYGRITPLLVASLQDAHKKIKELENKINSMENK